MILRPQNNKTIVSSKITKQTQLEAKIRLFRDYGNFEWFVPKKFETATQALEQLVNDDYVSDVLFGGAAGGGKSYTGWAWLMVTALAYKGINNVILRKYLNDITSAGMETFKEVAGNIGLIEGVHWRLHGGLNAILLDMNGDLKPSTASKIWFKGCDLAKGEKEVQSLGSTLYAYGFVEEGGQIPFIAFDTLAHSRLGRCPMGIKYGLTPKCFITCNPSDNWVKTEFYEPYVKGILQDFKVFINSLVDDNPFQTDLYKRNLDRLGDKIQRKRLRNGEWEYNTTDYDLCSPEAISDVFYNTEVKAGKRCLSSDIALRGKDLFTVLFANGLRCKIVRTMEKSGGRTLLKVIKEAAAQNGVGRSQIVFDGDGVGGFLDEFLEVSNSFHNGASPIGTNAKKEYDLLKTQCAYKLADYIEQRELYVECEDDPALMERITREFKCLKRQKNLDGKLKLISKDDMKEINGGKSTDYLDLFIMLMYFYLDEANSTPDISISVVNK